MPTVIALCVYCAEAPVKYGGLCAAHAEQQRRGQQLRPVRRRPRGSVPEVLRSLSEHNRETGCLEWTGTITELGYGRYGRQLAHRLAYMTWVGDVPEGQYVLHKCDNPPCIEPSHLYVGTQADNVRDMDARGRRVSRPMPGEGNPASRLTVAEVLAIRADGRPQRVIASEYGVTQAAISLIVTGKKWRHIL
jgi:hypothetical protein